MHFLHHIGRGVYLVEDDKISKSNSEILMREGVLHQHSEICKALGFMCWFCLEVELGKKNWLR